MFYHIPNEKEAFAPLRDHKQALLIHLAEQNKDSANLANLAGKTILLEDTHQFNPEHPIDLKHLITVQIERGGGILFLILDSLVAPLGRVFKRYIGQGMDRHIIIAVIETKVRFFYASITFEVSDTQVEIVPFSLIDKQLRCYKCFSPTHRASNCLTFTRGSSRSGRYAPQMVIKKE